MKKQLHLSLFVSLFVTAPCFAQVNDYFLNNPIWADNTVCSTFAPCIESNVFNYYINGDTIINNLQYKVIYRKGIITRTWQSTSPNSGCTTGTFPYMDTVPSFFLRSAGKQMYAHIPNQFSQEELIYDFNLQVGDSLPVTIFNNSPDITVTAIDSFYTATGYRKRFHLDQTNTWCHYLIEGVGTDRGLMAPMQVPLECDYSQVCYGQQDTTYYPNIVLNCDIALLVQQVPAEKLSLPVYPNPATDELQLGITVTEQKYWQVRDICGAIVLQGSPAAVISVTTLAPGYYFAEVGTGNKTVLRSPFIKQ